jgi:hypothetical protein
VTELVEILDRFTTLSDGAIRACAANDVEGLNRALDAREVILARARDLAPVLDAGALPREVRDRLAAVARADAELASVVRQSTAQTRAELDRIGSGLVAVGGYAAAMPRFRRLDLRR